ncbi:MAG: hypothetical protein P8X77_09620 [Maritimibacter sp.]
MNKVENLASVVDGLRFKKQEYYEAEEQLLNFANSYMELDPGEADQLRKRYDGKEEFSLPCIALTILDLVTIAF